MIERGRVLHAGLELLDRQLLDRDGRRCGKVDDVELGRIGRDRAVYVTAIHTGPGSLATALGAERLGRWLRRAFTRADLPDEGERTEVPIRRVTEIGNHVTLSLTAEELATFDGERWTRDHVIGPIPGSRHDAAG